MSNFTMNIMTSWNLTLSLPRIILGNRKLIGSLSKPNVIHWINEERKTLLSYRYKNFGLRTHSILCSNFTGRKWNDLWFSFQFEFFWCSMQWNTLLLWRVKNEQRSNAFHNNFILSECILKVLLNAPFRCNGLDFSSEIAPFLCAPF